MSIRFKVTVPYFLLTLIVAFTGLYVVTRLVSNTLEERLRNQLLQAGRVVSDEMATLEQNHLKAAAVIAYTRGAPDAIREDDQQTIATLSKPATVGLEIESLIVMDSKGRDLLHYLVTTDGIVVDAGATLAPFDLPVAHSVIAGKDPNSLPVQQFGTDPKDGRGYYFTAIPVVADDQIVGVVVVGTSLDTLLPRLKSTSLADVTFYGKNGISIASTFLGRNPEAAELLTLQIPEDEYQRTLTATEVVGGETMVFKERDYSTAIAPLQVGDKTLGVFSVALPLNFILESSSTNRTFYIWIYSIAMVLVILIGYWISRLIVNPLQSLVNASKAIAGGDLEQRTGIRSKDEIGVLANTFDEMTGVLQERTLELEKTNKILEQMDRTKGSFIQISAHELRTPLTLIMGYSAMLEQKTKDDPEFSALVKGILDGSNRMTEIVDSMLDVSRIDNKTLTVKKTDLQINLLIQKVHKMFMFALDERKIEFKTIGLESLPLVPADSEMLFKVFYHIVMNAIKYTPDGGCVTVRGRVVDDQQDPEVEIAVKDTGIGIDPGSHELIFNKFYQTGEVLLHSSGKTKFKGGGPGLGLSIARGIVDAHHGRIWVESSGHDEVALPGSTFIVRLPLGGRGT
jgi:signal transduction histidine kinase